MKNIFKLSIISLIVLSLSSFFVYSLSCGTGALPDTAATFYGAASYSGSALAGKTVTAATADDSVSVTTGSDGSYRLVVGRCSGSIDTVTFTVCTRSAGTGTYAEGTSISQDLTASSECPATTTTTTTGGGSGGSSSAGGGGAAATTTPESTTPSLDLDAQSGFSTDEGYTVEQAQGEKATFTIGGTGYTAEVTGLTDNSVTIEIAGQLKALVIGELVEIDIDGDGTNDISVMLKSITAEGKAELVYKLLAKAAEPGEEEELEKEDEETSFIEEEAKKAGTGWIFIVGILVIGLIAYFIIKKKPRQEGQVPEEGKKQE